MEIIPYRFGAGRVLFWGKSLYYFEEEKKTDGTKD